MQRDLISGTDDRNDPETSILSYIALSLYVNLPVSTHPDFRFTP